MNVINVKTCGAIGDGKTDDTNAIKQAVKLASRLPKPEGCWDRGNTIFFPQGTYLVTDSLRLSEGVGLRGEGLRSTIVKVQPVKDVDGLMWKGPKDHEHSTNEYGRGGFLRDMTLQASASSKVRDMVSLIKWRDFKINDVFINEAGRYGLRIQSCMHLSVCNAQVAHSGVTNIWVGHGPWVSTTIRFTDCYINQSMKGPGADVAGLSLNLSGTIFEGNGHGESKEGIGIRVRSGHVTLIAPHFENNTGFDMWFGSHEEANIAVVNALILHGPYKMPGQGGAFFDKVTSGSIVGGDFSRVEKPIVFTQHCSGVSMSGVRVGVRSPEYTASGNTIDDYPGFLNYPDPITGQVRVTGRLALALHGNTVITHHYSGNVSISGELGDNQVTSVRFEIEGALPGDSVVVGFEPGMSKGVLGFGTVSSPNWVEATLLNRKGEPVVLEHMLRADVWRHQD